MLLTFRLKKVVDFPRPCSASDFRDLEAMILAFFDWNIFIPSPTHYVDLLMTDQVLDKNRDLLAGVCITESFDEVFDCLTDFVHYFLDISMQVLQLHSGLLCLFPAHPKLKVAKFHA